MSCTAPVYGHVCPQCLACVGAPCVRVRRTLRPAPGVLTYAHKERYAVWHAWEQPELPLDNVRGVPYKKVY